MAEDIQLLEQVGRGSFGVVWRALHVPSRQQVAVKLFLSENVESEVTMLARLRAHPNVLNFLGVVTESDDPYKEPQVALVTKFMTHGSLQDLLVRARGASRREEEQRANNNGDDDEKGGDGRGRLFWQCPRRLCALGAQAAAGVAHLHDEGVIHRDLACRNLLVDAAATTTTTTTTTTNSMTATAASPTTASAASITTSGTAITTTGAAAPSQIAPQAAPQTWAPERLGLQLAVADFGFARARKLRNNHTNGEGGSAEGSAGNYYAQFSASKVGPVRWESPETLRFRRYSPKSDSWMFGVCLWEMASGGETPWRGLTSQGAAHAV